MTNYQYGHGESPSLADLFAGASNPQRSAPPVNPFSARSFTEAAKPVAEAKPVKIELTASERIRAIKAVRTKVAGLGLPEARDAVDAAIEALNLQRFGDPIGTVRKDPRSARYSFAVAPGKVLLIDTASDSPAYKVATSAEADTAIQWDVVG